MKVKIVVIKCSSFGGKTITMLYFQANLFLFLDNKIQFTHAHPRISKEFRETETGIIHVLGIWIFLDAYAIHNMQ